MFAWRIFARFLARLFAYFDRRRKPHRGPMRYPLLIGPLESREPPSNAISSLHPIGLLVDIGIDPLAILPRAVVPLPESKSTPPSPKTDEEAHAPIASRGATSQSQPPPSTPNQPI